MGQYLSPPAPSDYQTKCAIIFYPDDNGAFYLQALKGQLSKLALRWIWEGDDEKQREIADIWLAHDLMTDEVFFRLDCEDIPFIIGDEDVNINVNCNCGCGGAGGEPTTIICYDSDGNPIVTPQLPVEPYQPTPDDGEWPQNPAEDSPPSGFADWTEFDAEACAASNGLWQAAYAWVTIAEGGVDLISTVAAALAIFAAQALAELLAVIGGASLIKMGEALVRIILSEQASDILNEAKSWLEDNKTEIVCVIFSLRYDIPTMQITLVRMLYAYVDSTLTLNDEEQAALREWARTIFPLNLLIAYFFEYQRYIDASTPVDCSSCAGLGRTYAGGFPAYLDVDQQTPPWFIASGITKAFDTIESQAFVGVEEGIDINGAYALALNLDSVTIDYPNGYECHVMGELVRNVNSGTPIVNESVLLHLADYAGDTTGYDHVAQVGDLTLPALTSNISTALLSLRRVSSNPQEVDAYMHATDIRYLNKTGGWIA